MPILMFVMPSCPYCVKGKDMLEDEILSGEVVVKDMSDAPTGVTGFPHFEEEETGEAVTGLVQPKEELFKRLKHTRPMKEKFNRVNNARFTENFVSGVARRRGNYSNLNDVWSPQAPYQL